MVVCDYCGEKAVLLLDSSEIYSKNYGPVWICRPCDAWVGTHKNSKLYKPLGRLADLKLRRAKILAHFWFDLLWKRKCTKTGCSKTKARKAAYNWLSKKLGVPFFRCHIGAFDALMCRKVVAVCRPIIERKK